MPGPAWRDRISGLSQNLDNVYSEIYKDNHTVVEVSVKRKNNGITAKTKTTSDDSPARKPRRKKFGPATLMTFVKEIGSIVDQSGSKTLRAEADRVLGDMEFVIDNLLPVDAVKPTKDSR